METTTRWHHCIAWLFGGAFGVPGTHRITLDEWIRTHSPEYGGFGREVAYRLAKVIAESIKCDPIQIIPSDSMEDQVYLPSVALIGRGDEGCSRLIRSHYAAFA